MQDRCRNRIISHLKSSRSLIIQMRTMHEKAYDKNIKDIDMVLKLGKLAFQQLEKRNLIFYKEDLKECGIDVQEASVYSGLCTQIFREESGLFQWRVYCFVHLSVQEHLAALYVYFSFVNQNINVIDQPSLLPNGLICVKQGSISISDLCQKVVRNALQSTSGHLDLFLRFFLGFSLESNQMLLRGLLTQIESSSDSKERIVNYIKRKIKENPSPEKSINLFHCLNKLNDHSLVEEIQHYLKSGLGDDDLTRKSYTTIVSVLTSKTSCLRELNLAKSNVSDSGLKLLCDGLQNPQCLLETLKIRLCGVTSDGCASLALVLRSNHSYLRGLNLSGNTLGDSGIKKFAEGLENPHCKLEILRLRDCAVTDEGCAALASALRSNPSHLRELDLSGNKFGDTGLQRLSVDLENSDCNLETLRQDYHSPLSNKSFVPKLGTEMIVILSADEGCADLASALRSNPSHLRELDLYMNNLGDSGIQQFSAMINDPNYQLLKLKQLVMK
ncbi:hypothetical protein cypCar_00037853 [Cyprinus carpio]|nr:hypothetical protein cypCar_00037853 [Cyprinus carpio]